MSSTDSLTASRPSFFRSRQDSQRSSTSSIAHSDLSGDAPSEATLSADYALQSGGAVSSSSAIRPTDLSRHPSMGSVVSGISSVSGYSDSPGPGGFHRNISGLSALSELSSARDGVLEPLDEERETSRSPSATPPLTPRPGTAVNDGAGITDTVIAQHVSNITVPETVAREFRERHAREDPPRPGTSGKMSTTSGGTGLRHTLTLKEQNSKIDKLSKENFDLKLKIHFLDQALQRRSDEGVRELVQENVKLHTDLTNEKKESLAQRKRAREAERRARNLEDEVRELKAAVKAANQGKEDRKAEESTETAILEDEITYLRECLEHSEITTEKLREDVMAKEVEKRRMADYIKNVQAADAAGRERDGKGVEEAMEMWKDLLEAETARREQADEDTQKLRDELRRLRADTQNTTNNHNVRTTYNIRNHKHVSTTSNHPSEPVDGETLVPNGQDFNGSVATSSTLVEKLQHENAELRRDLGAQTSMLTSRNRERERLQAEIEDLKLAARRVTDGSAIHGGRSVAGDSIFERSVSRAGNAMHGAGHERSGAGMPRSASRASGATRLTEVSDNEREREEWERKLSHARDDAAKTKMLNQELERELNAHLDFLSQAERDNAALLQEKEELSEDVQALSVERDELLTALEAKEGECEALRDEAVQTIDRLEEDLDHKEQEAQRVLQELEGRNEDFAGLEREMKNVTESLIQLEDDRAAARRRIQSLEAEVEEANRELETLDKRLREVNGKNERLEVQIESNQGEISFLREEQEGDKIKIGELEAAITAAHANIVEEKDRFRELEERLREERKQREILDSQEKQEVQKVLSDLNSQLAKSKEEVRKLRKSLSTKEVEASTWKEKLEELERNLREALGDLDGTRTSLLQDVHNLQIDLETAVAELDKARSDLAEKERLLRNRDVLLESTGLEGRRLADLLEKERQARRQDRQHFEQVQRSQATMSRTMHAHETRMLELETTRSQDKKRINTLEKQLHDQLLDRNNLLLALWNRLSTLCGTDWAQKYSLIDGQALPSVEQINRNLPGFNKNIILAVKTVEGIVGGFRQRIRTIEKDLWRDYQTLEHTLDVRVKRLDQLERTIQVQTATTRQTRTGSRGSTQSEHAEIFKLKGENKQLRADLQFQKEQAQQHNSYAPRSPPSRDTSRASMANTLLRAHSANAADALSFDPTSTVPGHSRQGSGGQAYSVNSALQPSEQRWIHRLKELERRLKGEREARLLDRSGARKRLEEGKAENEELRSMLERERERRQFLGEEEELVEAES
ncbi:hypothetical protein P152DRAFT_399641 [Eremomyces bilateralis CBS 781.70]|uniref:Anucleate primary sterigmata protein B n=1 Tax=Eremomyces bilateralis CBS 781.70 TaxID=1392243 RepID=A0A6G1FZH9_9PEZI|nr:uncharacterized protein P152DRAFT_399641 [Eremomyces bilateralis CBS 781.70]KAF1811257.1 hypothetical protein P152DRAFT_399641 [Eremomyces bilateralis CBS 781.70]